MLSGARIPTEGPVNEIQCLEIRIQIPKLTPPTDLVAVPSSEEAEPLFQKGRPTAGRFRQGLSFWRDISSPHLDRQVLSWISEGVRMNWNDKGAAPAARFRNQQSALDNAGFVSEQLEEMLQAGAVVRTRKPSKVMSPLGVNTRRNGKKRLVVDMRHVNAHLNVPKFKMDSLSDLSDLANPGDWMTSIDLAQSYYHQEMHPQAASYLGVEWEGEFYRYTVLPFGLKSAPRSFCKTIDVLLRHWRRQGLRVLAYMDDWLVVADSPSQVARDTARILHDCKQAGITVNTEKSQLQPTQSLLHLGFTVDTRLGTFTVSEERWEAMQNTFKQLATQESLQQRVHVKRLASATGQIVSMALALGDPSRLFTRALYAAINSAPTWRAHVMLDSVCREEIQFWLGISRRQFTGRIWKTAETVPTVRLACDASGIGWGGLIQALPGSTEEDSHPARGYFLPWERLQSSTHRELRGAIKVLQSLSRFVRGRVVQLQTDAHNLLHIVGKGSSNHTSTALAKQLYWLCISLGVTLSVVWVPRDRNTASDELSKFEDDTDWQLNPKFFHWADSRWGPHTADIFASDLNHLCPTFFSRFYCPGTTGVNAFTYPWNHYNCWINPPFHLTGRVIRKLQIDRARATIVVPVWHRRVWWNRVCPDGSHLATFVTDWASLPRSWDLFLPGTAAANQFSTGPPNWQVTIIRADFSQNEGPHLPLRDRCIQGGCPRCCPHP